MVYITTYTTKGEEKIWMFLDNVFRVLEKKKGKKSRLFFECSLFFSSLRFGDTFATSKGDLCERERAHTHTRARAKKKKKKSLESDFLFALLLLLLLLLLFDISLTYQS